MKNEYYCYLYAKNRIFVCYSKSNLDWKIIQNELVFLEDKSLSDSIQYLIQQGGYRIEVSEDNGRSFTNYINE
jgi:hypothetical protein